MCMCMCTPMQVHFHTLHTTACMTASNPPSGASLFLDTCCFPTSSVKRATLSVSDSTCLNPNWAWHTLLILYILSRWMGDRKSVKEKNQFEVVKHNLIDFFRIWENLHLSSFSDVTPTITSHLPKARVYHGLWRIGVHVRGRGLVHKGSKPHA